MMMLLIAAALTFPVAALLMWLWNTTIPQISPLKPLRYWQAFRLLLIGMIFFGTDFSLTVPTASALLFP